MRLLSSGLALAAVLSAGPVDFGLSELNDALAERKLKWRNLTELSLDAPETFRIEPYQLGGAHITGGDLRGLMYGMLEAAEQIHTTGKLVKTSGAPAVPLRGLRIEMGERERNAPPDFWERYFRMLARNRFNRIHVVFDRIEAPYTLPARLSRAAADYGIDFTLGLAHNIGAQELANVLMSCPAIRGVAFEPGAVAAQPVFAALNLAGRRVTLDLDGGTPALPLIDEAMANHVPLLRPAVAWPPSFEVPTPPLYDAAPGGSEAHAWFYHVLGRLGYDPKAEPPKDAAPAEWAAAKDIALWIAVAQQANLGGSDFVAGLEEAVRNRERHIASAKFTPPEIAAHLYMAAGRLLQTDNADLKLLAALARQQADQQMSIGNLPERVRTAPPTPWSHTPPLSAPSEQPLVLTLKIAQPKTVAAARLHYRPLDPNATFKVIEMPSAAQVSFTVPGADISGNWDLTYYFEILGGSEKDGAGNGWFEPDPLAATPYWTVRVIAPHTGNN